MSIEVRCQRDGESHRCVVTVRDGNSSTEHQVRVSASDLTRWSRGRSVEGLVRDSFAFLLERESKESILRQFDLSEIKRYFPEFDG